MMTKTMTRERAEQLRAMADPKRNSEPQERAIAARLLADAGEPLVSPTRHAGGPGPIVDEYAQWWRDQARAERARARAEKKAEHDEFLRANPPVSVANFYSQGW